MSATGKDTSSSSPAFLAALVTAAVTVGAFTAVWVVMHNRKHLREVYEPRAIFAAESKRPAPLPEGIISHWKRVLTMSDDEILMANGVDAYFFVRFLRVFGIKMMVPYFLLTCIILIPVSAASPNAGLTQLNKLTFGNVAATHQNRHIAHLLVALVLMFWTMYLLWCEYAKFVEVRQAWLASPAHLQLARTRTVALTGLPKEYNSESGIKELAGEVVRATGSGAPRSSNVENGESSESASGNVRNIWLTHKIKDLEQVWQDREDECARLEGGVSKLIKLGNKNERKGKTPEKTGKLDHERGGADMVDRFVLPKKRPTWKQGLLGLIGQKMTLELSPAYIADHNRQLETMREKRDEYENGDTAFVRFGSQHDAHAFARLAHKKHMMITTHVEMIPEDVVWSNIAINPYQRKVRKFISWGLTIGLIIIWAIPVAFVGAVSNVDALCDRASWLAWICRLPAPVVGIIQGVLPPALLAILFLLLPIVLRIWIKLQGEVRQSDIELKLFSRYWLFQVIHGFLIVTLASGLLKSLANFQPGMVAEVPKLLANNLPGASIFFLTFVLTATFTTAAKSYSRVVPFVMFLLKGILAGNTPRKAYVKKFKMANYMFGKDMPPICLIICLAIVYSVIQPIMSILTLAAFCMLYAAHKYTLYWCDDQPDALETGGLYYLKALRTVFVALYIQEIFLCALFFLSQNAQGDQAKSGLAGGAILVVVIVLTVALQVYIDWFRYPKEYLIYAHSTHAMLHQTASRAELNKTWNGAAPVPHSPEELDEQAGPQHGNTSGLHKQAFLHPAFWKKQPVVWIADDPLGIGKFEVQRINDARVESSLEYAHMDAKGNIDVERAPPDEAWYGGYSAATNDG